MDVNGQIYFASEDEIPEEDIKRLHAAEELALAKVGMRALVDEATGYQKMRAADDLYKYRKALNDEPSVSE